jgi:hypothetical protein
MNNVAFGEQQPIKPSEKQRIVWPFSAKSGGWSISRFIDMFKIFRPYVVL